MVPFSYQGPSAASNSAPLIDIPMLGPISVIPHLQAEAILIDQELRSPLQAPQSKTTAIYWNLYSGWFTGYILLHSAESAWPEVEHLSTCIFPHCAQIAK